MTDTCTHGTQIGKYCHECAAPPDESRDSLKALFVEQELSAGLLRRALKAEETIRLVSELPGKWRYDSNIALENCGPCGAECVQECADELIAIIKRDKP